MIPSIHPPEMSQKSTKTAAELESIVAAELREHSACDSAGVVAVRPMGLSWDAALVGDGPRLNSECNRSKANRFLTMAFFPAWASDGLTSPASAPPS